MPRSEDLPPGGVGGRTVLGADVPADPRAVLAGPGDQVQLASSGRRWVTVRRRDSDGLYVESYNPRRGQDARWYGFVKFTDVIGWSAASALDVAALAYWTAHDQVGDGSTSVDVDAFREVVRNEVLAEKRRNPGVTVVELQRRSGLHTKQVVRILGRMRHGEWALTVTGVDLTDADRERIAELIRQGHTGGYIQDGN